MRLVLLALGLFLTLLGCGESAEPSTDGRPVALALDFTPNAVHAGGYTAVREGADHERGVDLEIRSPGASTDSLKLLAAGAVDLAIVDIHDLGLARQRGEDVVGVGAIVQRPLAAVIAAREIERPRELEGRRVGVTGLPSDEAVLRAVVENDGGDYDAVETVTIGFSAVPSLVERQVDAVVSFWNAEGVALEERGVPTREFRVDRFGAPRYPELVLAARSRTIEDSPDLVRSALGALAVGTRSAIADPGPAAAEIARVGGADAKLVDAQLAAVAPALRPPITLDRAALERWARFDERFGVLEDRPDVEEAFALDLAPAP